MKFSVLSIIIIFKYFIKFFKLQLLFFNDFLILNWRSLNSLQRFKCRIKRFKTAMWPFQLKVFTATGGGRVLNILPYQSIRKVSRLHKRPWKDWNTRFYNYHNSKNSFLNGLFHVGNVIYSFKWSKLSSRHNLSRICIKQSFILFPL